MVMVDIMEPMTLIQSSANRTEVDRMSLARELMASVFSSGREPNRPKFPVELRERSTAELEKACSSLD